MPERTTLGLRAEIFRRREKRNSKRTTRVAALYRLVFIEALCLKAFGELMLFNTNGPLGQMRWKSLKILIKNDPI